MFKLMVGSGSVDYDNIVVDDDVDVAAATVVAAITAEWAERDDKE